MNYVDQLKANISDLAKKTLAREFEWVRENQTTYYCEVERGGSGSSPTSSFLISIQRVRNSSLGIGPEPDVYDMATRAGSVIAASASPFRYILQIKDLKLDKMALKADTSDDVHGDQIHYCLSQLYTTIQEQVSSQSLEAFNTVLGN